MTECDYDVIKKPKHYNIRPGIEPKDFINSNKMSWAEGNAIKYIYRAPFKENPVQDYEKAIEYINMLIQEYHRQAKQHTDWIDEGLS